MNSCQHNRNHHGYQYKVVVSIKNRCRLKWSPVISWLNLVAKKYVLDTFVTLLKWEWVKKLSIGHTMQSDGEGVLTKLYKVKI